MDWDHDTCLSCDRHIADGEKFCSQTCRLADLERAGYSEQATPFNLPTQAPSWMSWQMPTQNASSSRPQFLPPAVNFSAYKNSNVESPPASPRTIMAPRQHSTSSYFIQPSTTSSAYDQPTGRGLTTSPSRSSLSSVSSTSSSSTVTSPGISNQAMDLLRAYSGAFDQDRNWKRRVTLG